MAGTAEREAAAKGGPAGEPAGPRRCPHCGFAAAGGSCPACGQPTGYAAPGGERSDFGAFVHGFACLPRGAWFLVKHRGALLGYVVLPLVVNVISIFLSIWGVWKIVGLGLAGDYSAWTGWFWGSLGWLLTDGAAIVQVLAVVLVVPIAWFFVAIALAGPFNEMLSDQVDEILHGRRVADDLTLAQVILNGVRSGFRALRYLAILVPILAVTSLLSCFAPVVWLAMMPILCYFAAHEWLDVPFDRRAYRTREKRAFLWQNFWGIEGFGLAAWLGMYVPVLNLVIMPPAVVGATILYHESKK